MCEVLGTEELRLQTAFFFFLLLLLTTRRKIPYSIQGQVAASTLSIWRNTVPSGPVALVDWTKAPLPLQLRRHLGLDATFSSFLRISNFLIALPCR